MTTKEEPEPCRPDPRWAPRYRKVQDALEGLALELEEMATWNSDHFEATWSEYAIEAKGCLEGAQALLMLANSAREKYIAKWKDRPR